MHDALNSAWSFTDEVTMSDEITEQTKLLVELIRRKGVPDHKKKLLLEDKSAAAVAEMLKFLSQDVSVYSTHHVITTAPHVLQM